MQSVMESGTQINGHHKPLQAALFGPVKSWIGFYAATNQEPKHAKSRPVP